VAPLRFTASPQACALFFVAIIAAGSASAEGVDWSKIGATEIVEIISRNDDGEPHQTKTWIVTVGDAAYVRSTSRRLFANIDREPDVVLLVDGDEVPLRAALNEDPALAEPVSQAHLDKYPDCVICKLFQFRTPRVIELTARP
jgi:hypothetical protein